MTFFPRMVGPVVASGMPAPGPGKPLTLWGPVMNPQLLTDYALAHRLGEILPKLTDDEKAILNEACRRFSRPDHGAGARKARVIRLNPSHISTLRADALYP